MDHGTMVGSRSMVDSRPWGGTTPWREREERDEVIGVLSNDATWRRRWPHDGARQRWPLVLRWAGGFGRDDERLELGWVRWIMGVLSLCLL
jgi:hypothetical protein